MQTNNTSATHGAWRLGLDLGSTATKAVLLDPDGKIRDFRLDVSGVAPAAAADRLMGKILADNGVADAKLVATGYGRNLAGKACRTVTEISCHARGVRHLHPDAATVLDIGGQDAKAIRIGSDGQVEDFAMNDRCAAGTGCFLEVAARKFSLNIGELSAYCHDSPESPGEPGKFEISSTCVVFAESELIGLAARGVHPVDALRAVHRAIARRVTLLLKQVGAVEPLYFTGGVAANLTLRKALEAEIGLMIRRADHAQYAGALGAALFA